MSGEVIGSSNDDASFDKANRKQLLATTGTTLESTTPVGSGQLAFSTNTLSNGRKERGHYYSAADFAGTRVWTRLFEAVNFPINWGTFNPYSTTFSNDVEGMLKIASTSGTLALQSMDASHGRSVRFTTGSGIGNTSGINLGQQYTQRQWDPAIRFKIRVQETSNNRFYLGFTSPTSLLSGDDPLNAVGGVVFGKRSTDTNWHWLHNDGSGATNSVDTGIGITTGLAIITIQASDGLGAFNCYVETAIDEDYSTITTNIPSTTSDLSFQATYITTTAAARSFEAFQGLITSQR